MLFTAESKRLGTITGELDEFIRTDGRDVLWIIGLCISQTRFEVVHFGFPSAKAPFLIHLGSG